eukprot:scaffold111_cov252-Pinguiococcus_pyrenoidosus.AAC.15
MQDPAHSLLSPFGDLLRARLEEARHVQTSKHLCRPPRAPHEETRTGRGPRRPRLPVPRDLRHPRLQIGPSHSCRSYPLQPAWQTWPGPARPGQGAAFSAWRSSGCKAPSHPLLERRVASSHNFPTPPSTQCSGSPPVRRCSGERPRSFLAPRARAASTCSGLGVWSGRTSPDCAAPETRPAQVSQ